MSFWQGWLRQPQRVWLRRASFQIHLWIGLAIGLYIVMLSITGSALVYRNELDRYFATPRPTYEAGRKVLTERRAACVRREVRIRVRRSRDSATESPVATRHSRSGSNVTA